MTVRSQPSGSLYLSLRITLSIAVAAAGALIASVSADVGAVAPQSGGVSSTFGGGDGIAEVPGLGTSNYGAAMTITSTGRIVVAGDDDGTDDGTVIAGLEQNGAISNWLSDTGSIQIERTADADWELGEAVVSDGVGGFYVASRINVDSIYGFYVTHVGVDGLVESMSEAILIGSWHSTVADIAVDDHHLMLAVTAVTGATDQDLTLVRWAVSSDTGSADLSSSPQVASVDGGSESYWSRELAVAVGLQPQSAGSGLPIAAGTAYLRPGGTFSHNVGMIARFDSEHVLDPSFGTDGVAVIDAGDGRHLYVHAMHVAGGEGGHILVAGRRESTTGSADYDSFVLRLTSDGILDTTFGDDGILIIDGGGSDAAVAVVPVGDRLFVAHSTHSWSGWALSSWNLNGTERDMDFGEAGYVRSGGSYARVSTADALPNNLVGLLVLAEDGTWDVIAVDPNASSGGVVGPLIGSVTVEPASAGPGDTVVLSMEVSDDTGVQGAYFSLTHSTEGQRNYCTSSMSLASGSVTDGVWSSSCTLPDVVLNGTYEVYPYAEDVLGAWTNMNGQNLIPLRGSLTIDGGTDDVNGPVIGSVTVEPASAGPGDTVVLSMEVSDDTGVQGAYFSLTHSTEGQRNYCTSSMSLASGSVTDGVWSSSCTLPDVVLNGTYEVYPYAEDVLGAWTNMNGQNLIPLRGSLTIDDSVDNTPPVIVTATTRLEVGQNVVVQVSEPGTVYLIVASATVNQVSAISLLPTDQWRSAAVGTADIDVEVGTTDLSPGEYRLYAADAAGNLATPEEMVVTVVADSTSTTAPSTTAPSTTTPTTLPLPSVDQEDSTSTTAPITTAPSTTTPTTLPLPSVDQIAELILGEVLSPSNANAPELIPGSTMVLSVSGFVANETIQILLASSPRLLDMTTADSAGVVTFEATLPLDVLAGSHTLAVYSPASGHGVRQTIEVGHSPASATLPATGSGVPWIAFLMLACGIAILGVRRRRLQA